MKTAKQMNCPSCGTIINVDELLISQFEESIREELQSELSEKEAPLNQERLDFKKLSNQLTKEKEGIDALVLAKVKQQLHQKETALKEAIRLEINEERSQQLQELQNELTNKSGQLKELNVTKAQLEILKREFQEKETAIILQKEKEFTQRLEQTRLTIKSRCNKRPF